MPKKNLIIIADDLTGAMDSSGYLASAGLSVTVHLGGKLRAEGDVSVLSTDSRKDTPSSAAEKMRGVAQGLQGQVFKKIDSTLRGNIGAELAALMETLHYEKAILAPAFPAVGRTVLNGVLLVQGIPVTETEFARDPVTPVRQSHIPSLLRLTTGYTVGTLTLEDVVKGADVLSREFTTRPERILVCDSSEQSHLNIIARAFSGSVSRLLLAGSGGLARELHLLLDRKTERKLPRPRSHPPAPALILVGSRHPVTASQLKKAQNELHLPVLHLKTEDLNSGNRKSPESSHLAALAVSYLEKGQSVAITSTFSRFIPALEQRVTAEIAETASAVLAAGKARGLFLSGGDTATAVCRALGASKIRVDGEIEPGMPAGELFIGRKRLNLVTKAGAFGEETAIVKSMPYLERGIYAQT